jgi:hypothetical protein
LIAGIICESSNLDEQDAAENAKRRL